MNKNIWDLVKKLYEYELYEKLNKYQKVFLRVRLVVMINLVLLPALCPVGICRVIEASSNVLLFCNLTRVKSSPHPLGFVCHLACVHSAI